MTDVADEGRSVVIIHEDDIRRIVRAVLDAESERREKMLDDVVIRAVGTILTSFGMEEEDRLELRADFVHLRKWRKSVEQAQSVTFRAIIMVVVSGIIGAIWLGIKTVLGK